MYVSNGEFFIFFFRNFMRVWKKTIFPISLKYFKEKADKWKDAQ